MKQALWDFPKYLLGIFLGICLAILTEIEMTLMVFLGILIGFTTSNALIGITIVFGIYTVFYILNQYIQTFNRNFVLFLQVMKEREKHR